MATATQTAPSLLTIAAAADACSLSQKSVRRAIDAGDLPHVRFGRAVRIPADALRAWIASKTVSAR